MGGCGDDTTADDGGEGEGEDDGAAVGDDCYTLTMKDTYGDGWGSGNYWEWIDGTDATISTGTLQTGSSGTAQLCGDGCHTLNVVGGGSYYSEVRPISTHTHRGPSSAAPFPPPLHPGTL